MDTKIIGSLTELQCITSFYQLGYKVCLPYGENSRYDFIADINGKLIRVQVKTCTPSNDGSTIEFSCRSTNVNSKGCHHKRYTSNEIDYFATYFNGMCYLVSVNECSITKKLRLKETLNYQLKGVNYAKQYELPTQIERMIEG